MITIDGYLKQSPKLMKVVVGYLIDHDKVLLGLRKKVSLGLGKQLISGIGGKVEGAETYKQALNREMQEEIAVSIKRCSYHGHVTFLFPHKPKWNQEGEIYVINEWTGTPKETDAMQPLWLEKINLPKEQMWEDNLLWIPKVLSGEIVNAIFLYDQDNRVVEYKM